MERQIFGVAWAIGVRIEQSLRLGSDFFGLLSFVVKPSARGWRTALGKAFLAAFRQLFGRELLPQAGQSQWSDGDIKLAHLIYLILYVFLAFQRFSMPIRL